MYYVYKFYNKKGELIYVGKTINIDSRIIAHISEENWKKTEIYKIECALTNSKTDMDIYEMYYINLLKPKYNIAMVNDDKPTFYLPELNFAEYDKSEIINNNEYKTMGKSLLNEQRLEYLIWQKVREIQDNTKLTNDQFKELIDYGMGLITINIGEYTKLFKTVNRNLIKELDKASYRLVNRRNEVFKSYMIDRGAIVYRIKPYLIDNLAMLISEYDLFNINPNGIKNRYTNIIYNLLKNNDNTLNIDTIRNELSLLETEYPEYSNLKQRIIIPVINELKNLGMYSEFKEVKNKRKVEKILFI